MLGLRFSFMRGHQRDLTDGTAAHRREGRVPDRPPGSGPHASRLRDRGSGHQPRHLGRSRERSWQCPLPTHALQQSASTDRKITPALTRVNASGIRARQAATASA